LLTEDPGRDAKLPLDDASWDKGVSLFWGINVCMVAYLGFEDTKE
jgi:hypothetical protein